VPDGSCQDCRFRVAAPLTYLIGSKRGAGQEIVGGRNVGWRRSPNRGTGPRTAVRSQWNGDRRGRLHQRRCEDWRARRAIERGLHRGVYRVDVTHAS